MEGIAFRASSQHLGDGTRVVAVAGEIDLYTAPEFERALEPNGGAGGRVVVDLSDCTFLDSTGLGVLVQAHRRIDSNALLIVANGLEVLRAFEVTGLDRHFVLHPTLEVALNGGAVSGWRDKEARNQALSARSTSRLSNSRKDIAPTGNPDCTQQVGLTAAEYERVREHASRFVVALNHENPETESIVEQNERFVIVETFAGASSRIARETDPRSQRHLRTSQPAAYSETKGSS